MTDGVLSADFLRKPSSNKKCSKQALSDVFPNLSLACGYWTEKREAPMPLRVFLFFGGWIISFLTGGTCDRWNPLNPPYQGTLFASQWELYSRSISKRRKRHDRDEKLYDSLSEWLTGNLLLMEVVQLGCFLAVRLPHGCNKQIIYKRTPLCSFLWFSLHCSLSAVSLSYWGGFYHRGIVWKAFWGQLWKDFLDSSAFYLPCLFFWCYNIDTTSQKNHLFTTTIIFIRRNRNMSFHEKGMAYIRLSEWLRTVPFMEAVSADYFKKGMWYLQRSSIG